MDVDTTIAGFAIALLNSTPLPYCNCSDIRAPRDPYRTYNFFVIIIGLPVIATFGLITNVFNLYVYTRRPMSLQSCNIYLAALACSDFLVVFSGMFLLWMDSARSYVPSLNVLVLNSLPVQTLGNMAQTSSVYFTVAAAFDCYVRVCCSTKLSRVWCTVKMALFIIACLIFFAIGFNFIQFWLLETVPCIDYDTKVAKQEICPTELYFEVDHGYNIYTSAVVMTFLPFFLLCVLDVLIIRKVSILKKQNLTGESASVSGDDTITMIMVVILFLVCNSLALIISVLDSFLSVANVIIHYMADVSNLLVLFNSSVNFLIYIGFDKAFRYLFVTIFCCWEKASSETMQRNLSAKRDRNGYALASPTDLFDTGDEWNPNVRMEKMFSNPNNNNGTVSYKGCYVPYLPQAILSIDNPRSSPDKKATSATTTLLNNDVNADHVNWSNV